MKDSIDFAKFLFEQENPWMIIVSVILAMPFLIKLLKEISTISHTIEIKNIEAFSLCINEENSLGAKYKLEKYFGQLYKCSLTYKEIKYLLSFDSPSTAIEDCIYGISYLKFEDHEIIFKKDYWFNVIKLFNGFVFIISSIVALISFLLFLAGLNVSAEGKLLFNLAFLTVSSFIVAWFTLNELRNVYAALRVVKNQPKIEKFSEGVQIT